MDIEAMPQGRKPWPALTVGLLLLALFAALLLSLWRGAAQLQDDLHTQHVSMLAEQLERQFSMRLSSYEALLKSFDTLDESMRVDHSVLARLPVWQLYPELKLFYGLDQGDLSQVGPLLHLKPLAEMGQLNNVELEPRQQAQLRRWRERGAQQVLWLIADQAPNALMLMPLPEGAAPAVGLVAAKVDLSILSKQLLGSALAERYQLTIGPVKNADSEPAGSGVAVGVEVQGQRWLLTMSYLPAHDSFAAAELDGAYQRWVFAWIVIFVAAGLLLWCVRQMRLMLASWQRADEENQRWQLGLEASPNMIIVLDDQYRVIRLNHQAEHWLTQAKQSGCGQSIEHLLPAELCQWLREVSDADTQSGQLYLVDSQGIERALEVSYSRLQVADQHWIQLVINDVSQHVATERSLREHVEQLAQSTRYKYEFLANLSHELRTPLSSILILSHALKSNARGNLTDKQVRHAGVIHHSGSVLLALINNLLELAKLDAGVVVARPERVQLVELLEAIESKVRPKTQAKGLSLELTIAPDVPKVVYVDRYCLQELLRQLLENALKFTDQGSIKLRVSYEQQTAEQVLQITVSDTGVGIAAEHQQHIFEIFHQVDGSSKRRTTGMGLGLSICQRVVALLNGTLELQSQLEQGTRLTVRVPLALTSVKPISAAPLLKASAAPSSPLQGQRVLLLEADMRSLYRTAAQLDSYGLVVRSVGDQQSAVSALHEQEFDALIMGVPKADAPAFALIIEQCLARDIPVLALLDNPDEGAQVVQAGFSGSLAKPFDAQLLLELLRHHLPARRQHA